MIPASIKSRPVYGTLVPRSGAHHLFVADADGALAILDMARHAPPDVLQRSSINYVPGDTKHDHSDRLRALNGPSFHTAPSIAALLPRLSQSLANARMGTRLYLTGTEGLIGQVMRLAMEAGIDHASIETEHRGSLARRVQCVHCKGITENVTTQPAICSHCGLTMFVRDHYSRRIAAFQGVRIDAEVPGEVPPTEEIFP